MVRLGLSALIAVVSGLQAAAQLSGSVGPLTTRATKAAKKTCNIMDYGGVASATTDNSDAISKAWAACKTTGGEVYVPEGDYGLGTWLKLSGDAMSFRLDGTIYRIGTDGGNMLMFQHMSDFEFYSSTSKGAIQGYGYEFHKNSEYGPRILRFYDVTDFSVHDVALVDSPAFHFSMDTCTNGEVYNMVIHGGNRGGLDGIDVWSTNIWIHDVEVSNKDECVTVKSPAKNILVENIFCNWSGGSAMGSLGADVDISDIEYNNVYSQNCNQMYMFKSYGGSGTVSNVALKNFIGHSNAYTLDLDATWSSMSAVSGNGVTYTNFTFSDWKGTCANGHSRGPIKFNCPPAVPCTDMIVEDFNVWTEAGSYVEWWCMNAYGSGVCLNEGTTHTSYTTTQTVSTVTGYSIQTMTSEISSGLGLTASIAIPTLRASFFPGVAAISPLMANSDSVAATGAASTSAVVATSTAAAAAASTKAATSAAATKAATTSAAAADKVATLSTSLVAATTSAAPVESSLTTPVNTPTPVASNASSKVSEVPQEAASDPAATEPETTPAPVSTSQQSRPSSACKARRRRAL